MTLLVSYPRKMTLESSGRKRSRRRGPVEMNDGVITDEWKFPEESKVGIVGYRHFSKLCTTGRLSNHAKSPI